MNILKICITLFYPHIDTQYLWIQGIFSLGRAMLKKIPGDSNSSDLMTKHVPAPHLNRLLEAMGVRFAGGAARGAKALAPD